MKKKLCTLLVAALATTFAFTGCQDDKPYSSYQIGVEFPELAEVEKIPVEAQTEQQKQDLKAARLWIEWLWGYEYIRTYGINGALIIEGGDENLNDSEALKFYNAKYQGLLNIDLDQKMSEIKTDNPELTGTGRLKFEYMMTKGSTAGIMPDCNKVFYVNY